MTEGILTRVIPARKKVVRFQWIKADFTEMSSEFRRARRGMKPLDACFWCGTMFRDGDIMGLGGTPKGNKILCQTCVTTARNNYDQSREARSTIELVNVVEEYNEK